MGQPIQLLIPMSGQGERFRAAGYPMPKPSIPIHGKTIIERLLEAFPQRWDRHFVLAENHRESALPGLLATHSPFAKLTYIPPHREGPARAILAALPSLPREAPILVSYCDYGMVWDADAFERFVLETGCDAAVVCYRGFHPHYLDRDNYAYCRMQGDRVVEVREKGSFTENYQSEFASAGTYYFRNAEILAAALEHQYANKLLINGEYYTSLTVQALLERNPNADVRVFEIPKFFQWGTPRHLKQYEYWERVHTAKKTRSRALDVEQLLIPMAGYGSRFQSMTSEPKPLIPVRGEPMFRRAAEPFRSARPPVFVTHAELGARLGHVPDSESWVFLDRTPAGQALTTQAGVTRLDPNASVLVTACDHEAILEPARFEKFLKMGADAAIFTVRGFPQADRKPHAFAYVQSVPSDDEFPRVAAVSVKKPISDTPSADSLLVGTFWFRTAALLDRAIEWLKAEGRTVNGEYYLDAVFELMIARGHCVREIPLDGYDCWGDPDALRESAYWSEVFA